MIDVRSDVTPKTEVRLPLRQETQAETLLQQQASIVTSLRDLLDVVDRKIAQVITAAIVIALT